MVSGRHKFQTLEQGIHGFISFEYANAAARLAATGFTADDKYKASVDLDTGIIHIITDITGGTATWSSVVGDGSGVNIAAGTQTALSGTVTFANSHGISFGMSGSNQITASYTVPSLVGLISAINVSGGTTNSNVSAITFSNANGVSFGFDGSIMTASIVPGVANINFSAGTTSNNLTAITFSNSNGLAFGLNGSVITGSYTVPTQTNQTVGLYATGNTTQNSSTTLDARSLSFNAIGAATMGYSNGSIQVSVPAQTAQTQSLIQAVYDGANSISTGTIRFTNANGISFSINGQTISGSVAAQTNQTIGLFALGNTTQNSSTTLDARSLSFNGLGAASVGYSNGSIQISVPNALTNVNISAGTTSNNLTALVFSNSNNVSFGLNGSTVTAIISVPAQTAQTVGLYVLGNTTQNSSTTLDARSLSFNALGIITAGYSNGSIQISATQSAQTQNVVVPSAGTQTATSGTAVFSNSNNITFGMSGSSIITASYNFNFSAGTTSNNLNAATFSNSNGISFGLDAGTITASYTVPSIAGLLSAINVSAGTTSNNLSAIVFSNSNNVSFGLNGSTVTATISVPAQTNQTLGLFATGNTTQNSSTVLDARSLTFNGLGAATLGFSNGSVQVSVPVQTVQTQSLIQAIYDGANSITTGTIRFTNANGVSFSINGQTISGSVAPQTNQTVGLFALGNTTQNSSTTLDARSLSFNGLGAATVGYSNGSIQISVPNALTNVNISAGTTSNNLTAFVFSNSNNVSFGLNGSTVTATITVPAQTNQTLGLFVTGNTTQNSSTILDARSLTFNGLGAATLGYSNGSIQVSVPVQTVQTQSLIQAIYDGANSISTGTIRFINANGVSFSINGQTISGSVAAQSNQTEGFYAVGNTVGQSSSSTFDARTFSISGAGIASVGYSAGNLIVSVPAAGASINFSAGTTSNNLNAITFSNSNGLAFGLNGSTITGSYTVPTQTNQTVGLYALGNTTQNSSTTLDARTLSFNGLGAASVGYSNGSIQVSVPVQTAQTQSNIQAIYDGVNSVSTGTIRFTNANGVSFSINGQTISGSVAVQTNQTIGLYALGNTTQNSSTTLDARSLSFNGLGIITAGYSNGSIQISAIQSVQTAGLYALGNTTQNSSTTLDLRTLSYNGLGAMTVGYSNGSIQLSAPGTSSLSATGAVSISVNGSTISIGAPVYKVSNLIWPQNPWQTNFTISNASFSLQQFNPGLNITATQANFLMALSGDTNSSGALTISLGIYTMAGSTMSLVSSDSVNLTWTSGSQTTASSIYGGQSGTQYRTISLANWSISAGNYMLGMWFRTTNNGTWRAFGQQGPTIVGALDGNQTNHYYNGFSTSSYTTAMVASINMTNTNFVRTGANALQQPGLIFVGTI